MQIRWGYILFSAIVLYLSSFHVHAQAQLRGMLTTGMGDIAAIKQKAEAGDPNAQVALADSLVSNFHSADALTWYRKAAQQANSEGAYQVGRMLLRGSPGIPKEQAVVVNAVEGILWTFRAATNHHGQACREMSMAYQKGWGVVTNLTIAYAWMQLASEYPSGKVVAKVELNQLALKLDLASISRAQALAADFRSGKYESPSIIVSSDPAEIRLSSITWGKTPLAIISGKTLAQGESANIKTKTRSFAIQCVKIEKSSVVIAVEGESELRTLYLH